MKTVVCKDINGNESQIAVDKLQWRISAYGIVIRDDCILLLKQKTGYDLPGGGIDLGEILEAGVIREVKEETGLTVEDPKLIGAETSFFKLPGRVEEPYVHSVMLYYVCNFVGGEISNDGFDEWEKEYAEGAEWIPLSQLDDLTIGSSKDYRLYVRSIMP